MFEMLFQALVFPGFLAAFVIGFLYLGIMRKVAAHMQHRIGPPIWQPFLDFFKLLSKENIQTKDSVGFLLTLCPIISFASVLTVIIFVPVAGFGMVSFQGSVFVVIYFLVMSSAFLALAGFATGNPFGSVGSIREITQLVSYEFPFVVSLITIGYLTGFEIIPYFSLHFPFAFLAFLTGVLGKLSLPPFHIPEAEQEIVAGPLTEYSGPRLAMFELARAIGFWVLISIGAVFFLGAGNIVMFAVNSLALLFVLIIFRVVFARLRISNAFRLYWFIIGPLAVIDLVRALVGFY
ncbi:MAG: NADH-quinone oxidoreductase subunit H [Candidatus Aenigmarchaeota archaeon]|nr:NADH-quinone oxidoreductase subunit H [Candidatus Aenigmarchaeota archaeon]